MADYYSLLARAVANLPKSSPPSTRRAIYERARKALTNQLRSLKPQLPESDIAREERALDEAVARLETEFSRANAEPQTVPAEAPAFADQPVSAPRPPEPPRRPLANPSPPLRPPSPARSPITARAPAAPAPRPPSPRPAASPPPVGQNAVAAAPPSPPSPPKGSAFPLPPPPEPYEPPAVSAQRVDSFDREGAPALGMARAEREPSRPTLGDGSRRRTSTWLWVGAAVGLGFAGSIAAIALFMRPSLQELTAPAPVDSPVASASPAPSEKTAQRVSTPTTEPTPSPAATTAEAPPPAPSPTAAPAPAPAPAPTIPVASRAAMLVATVADAAKPAINVGNAVWSLTPGPPGQPAAIAVKAEIDIPDLKMHASMVLKKNLDASLPASHTIDLRVTFEPGSSIKGVKDIALPLMRTDDPPAADALTGVRVKISDNYFLVGLNRAESDVSHNIQEIGERNWFDFPMQLDDDRIAKLTFEKGGDGEKLIAQALAAWK